jgi:dUTPase
VSATPATPDVLRVQRLRPDEPFTLPARQHEHDAGLDLCVSRPATVMPYTFNPTGDRIVVQEGERLFQLLLHHNIRIDVQEFAYLPPGERGTEGFGSTGGYARPRGTMPGEAQ